MSAMTGICDFFAMRAALGVSWTARSTRTILAAGGGQLGDLLQRRVHVGGEVVVIDCHRDRRSPADGTEPTMIWRDCLRSAERRRRHRRHTSSILMVPNRFVAEPGSSTPPLNHHRVTGRA